MTELVAETIRVRGTVQGVGFRPTVARLARRLGLRGSVRNDGSGVTIELTGDAGSIDDFVARLALERPPLAIIDAIERQGRAPGPLEDGFRIDDSRSTAPATGIAADAASCDACVAETKDPFARRYRYPFTNCTHCGPRLSITRAIPYDRGHTSMAAFAMCDDCRREYEDEDDRRYHAQPLACHACGPRVTLSRADGRAVEATMFSMMDATDAVCTLLRRGEIVAIKGIGGYHLACDATIDAAVSRLRVQKQRDAKPFAMMARDLDVLRRYASPTPLEEETLRSPARPIVLLRRGEAAVADEVAPGQSLVGFMLPYTPLHHLVLARSDRPIVLTSGNVADEPQVIDDAEAKAKLSAMADYFLVHDRAIVQRVDDSVVKVIAGVPTVLRRGRGYAPQARPLPPGLTTAPPVLAAGADLKGSLCFTARGEAVLTQHLGDLGNVRSTTAWRETLELHSALAGHRPAAVAIDAHPDSRAAALGTEIAERHGVPVVPVLHHHAHVAACMVEAAVPDGERVIGLALDGLGWGEDELWGGEVLIADYTSAERVGTLKPVALLGGDAAAREPWRSLYAHLMAEMGWAELAMNFEDLELVRFLGAKPRATLDAMLASGTNAPKASSAGRLFDAVAAAIGVRRERASFEGQAAMELEALVCPDALAHEDEELAYPFAVPRLRGSNLPYIEPLAMWRAVLGDLLLGTPPGVIAARFHRGFARALVRLTEVAAGGTGIRRVALTGGVFQNAILSAEVRRRLEEAGYEVLVHREVPPNDGGIALGQAAIASARWIRGLVNEPAAATRDEACA
ncbi:MAG: carbamoyltransferase HypF [Labilithrix sp.]|nr:carbamoyltransferase HypF [Labilithrix sp.]